MSGRSGDRAEILVVDDNRVNRLLVAQLLEQLKHRVSFAENGQRALEVLRDHPADLVLLDVEMPEMNGYETLEALQADPKQRDLFRKFATAEVAEELLSSGFALGGKHVDATVMFSDIRGFTALAESLAPADTIQLLNNYYTLMFDAIESQG